MVETTETDVVGPAVTADDPHAAPDQVFGDGGEMVSGRRTNGRQFCLQLRYPLALVMDAGFACLVSVQQRLHLGVTDFQRHGA